MRRAGAADAGGARIVAVACWLYAAVGGYDVVRRRLLADQCRHKRAQSQHEAMRPLGRPREAAVLAVLAPATMLLLIPITRQTT